MAYASRTDFVARFGESEVSLLEDFDNAGFGDEQATAVALQDASDEADGYIAVVMQLPLPAIPPTLTNVVCDIARFRLYKDRATEEVKYRYEQSIKWLTRVSARTVTLVLPSTLTPAEQSVVVRPKVAVGDASDGLDVFSDAVLAKRPVAL